MRGARKAVENGLTESLNNSVGWWRSLVSVFAAGPKGVSPALQMRHSQLLPRLFIHALSSIARFGAQWKWSGIGASAQAWSTNEIVD